MEGVLFIIIVFGGGMVMLLSKSDIGRAMSERIRGVCPNASADPAMKEDVERLRAVIGGLRDPQAGRAAMGKSDDQSKKWPWRVFRKRV